MEAEAGKLLEPRDSKPVWTKHTHTHVYVCIYVYIEIYTYVNTQMEIIE